MTLCLTFRSGWGNKETGRRINGGRDYGRSKKKNIFWGGGGGDVTPSDISEASLYRCCNGDISMWKVRIVMFSGLP